MRSNIHAVAVLSLAVMLAHISIILSCVLCVLLPNILIRKRTLITSLCDEYDSVPLGPVSERQAARGATANNNHARYADEAQCKLRLWMILSFHVALIRLMDALPKTAVSRQKIRQSLTIPKHPVWIT